MGLNHIVAVLAASTARAFPLAIVTLVVTGGFLVSFQHRWSWELGWVRASLTMQVRPANAYAAA